MATLYYTSSLKGTGSGTDQLPPISVLKSIALVRPGFTFANGTGFATLATWLAAIAAKNIFIIDNIVSQESIQVEDGTFTAPMGQLVPLGWYGMRGFKLKIMANMDQYVILKTYHNLSWEVIYIDRAGYIHGVKDDAGTIHGFDLATFIVGGQVQPSETEPALTPITLQEDDPLEFHEKVIVVKPSWRVKSLVPLTYVTLSASTVAAFTYTLTASLTYAHKLNADGSVITIPLTGLLATDLAMTKANGTSDAVVSCTETAVQGVYTVVGTAVTSGTVRLVPSATLVHESNTLALVAA
jgi:hypothetical protein